MDARRHGDEARDVRRSGDVQHEKKIRDAFRSLLELLFAAASLLIDTVRTFFLVVLSILGPLAFAFSVWDGFQSTLTAMVRTLHLRLPVAARERPVSAVCLRKSRYSCCRATLPSYRATRSIQSTTPTACT